MGFGVQQIGLGKTGKAHTFRNLEILSSQSLESRESQGKVGK